MHDDKIAVCAADVILRLLKGRWATQVLLVLITTPSIHFGALKRAIPGVSAKVLSEQLRFLERAQVIVRKASDARQEVNYSLTPRGWELKRVLDDFHELALRWDGL